MCCEISISFQDVKLVCCFLLVVSPERPSTRALSRVFGRKVECTKGEAKVEVREDKLDAMPVSMY